MSEKDPLIAKGDQAIEKSKIEIINSLPIPEGSLLCMMPFAFFYATMQGMWSWFHHEHLKIYILFGVLIMIACLCAFASKNGKKKWLVRLSILLVLAMVVGIIASLFIYYKWLVYYWAYHDMNSYTNVAASQSAEQFSDAGFLLFSGDSNVDSSKAVGFRDAKSATTICLAPITDSTFGSTTPVTFWAVGQNCCEPRATFTCDNPGGKAGVLQLGADLLVSPSMEPIVEGLGGFVPETYDRAMVLSEAAWSTVAADYVRFVRWTDDPVGIRDEFRAHGLNQLVWFMVAYFFLSVALGILSLPKSPNPLQEKSKDQP